MVSSIAILGLLPWLDLSKIRSSVFRPIWKQFVFLFVLDFFILMYVGGMPAEGIYLLIGRVGTAYWFLFFLIIAPLVSLIEKPLPMPNSIHEFEQWKNKAKLKLLSFFNVFEEVNFIFLLLSFITNGSFSAEKQENF